MKRDHWLCQDCLAKGIYTPAEEVHHIIPLTPENIEDPAVNTNPENLIALCRECHKQRHIAMRERRQNLGERRVRRYTVDEWGRAEVKGTPPMPKQGPGS